MATRNAVIATSLTRSARRAHIEAMPEGEQIIADLRARAYALVDPSKMSAPARQVNSTILPRLILAWIVEHEGSEVDAQLRGEVYAALGVTRSRPGGKRRQVEPRSSKNQAEPSQRRTSNK